MKKPRGGHNHKVGVLALVGRTTGTMRSFTFDKYRREQVHPIVRANISREARLMTDEPRMHAKLGTEFSEHGTTLQALADMSATKIAPFTRTPF